VEAITSILGAVRKHIIHLPTLLLQGLQLQDVDFEEQPSNNTSNDFSWGGRPKNSMITLVLL